MTGQNRFDTLDGLRGIAAIMVLLGHTSAVIAGPDNMIAPRKELAVVFFFMLSGFVITAAYQQRVQGGLPPFQFLLKRIVRLYPLVFLSTITGVLWFSVHAHDFATDPWWPLPIVTSVLVLPSIHVPYNFGRFPLNPPEWSLFMEMIAYIFFALTLAKLTNRSLSFVIFAAFVAYTFVDFKYFGHDTPFPLGIFQALAAFSSGVLLWRLRETGWFPRIFVPGWVLAAGIVGICIMPNRFGATFDIAASLLAFPLIIMFGSSIRGRPALFVEQWLGDLSYPLYLMHWTVILAAQYYILPSQGIYTAEVIGIVCALVFAWLAFVLFDRPVRAWLTRKLVKTSKMTATRDTSQVFTTEEDSLANRLF